MLFTHAMNSRSDWRHLRQFGWWMRRYFLSIARVAGLSVPIAHLIELTWPQDSHDLFPDRCAMSHISSTVKSIFTKCKTKWRV